MEMTALKVLQKEFKRAYPNSKPPRYNDENANGLTRCIVDYINLKGYQSERILCMGAPIPVGNGTYRMGKTSMDKGTADISATIRGISVKIEVKIGRDKLSSFQIAYGERVRQAGGIYYVAKDFGSFYNWFESFREEVKGEY